MAVSVNLRLDLVDLQFVLSVIAGLFFLEIVEPFSHYWELVLEILLLTHIVADPGLLDFLELTHDLGLLRHWILVSGPLRHRHVQLRLNQCDGILVLLISQHEPFTWLLVVFKAQDGVLVGDLSLVKNKVRFVILLGS